MSRLSWRQILKRKWNTFRHSPIGSTIHRIRMLLDWCVAFPLRYCDEQSKARTLRQRRYLELLTSRPQEAFPPNCADLWFLYQTVRRRKPRTILEFGSGCSTVILAQALWENRREANDRQGRLYSIESDAHWRDVTARCMPSHLADLCDIQYSPAGEVDYGSVPAFRHTTVPDVVPELVYLDGPPLTEERQVAIDLLDLEPRFTPGFCLVVDGRWKNVLFLKRHLKRRYRVSESGWSFNHSRNRHMFELVG